MQGMKPRPHTTKHVQTLRVRKALPVPEVFAHATACRCDYPVAYTVDEFTACRACSRQIRKETPWSP